MQSNRQFNTQIYGTPHGYIWDSMGFNGRQWDNMPDYGLTKPFQAQFSAFAALKFRQE
jgi:hypothetical protein